VVGELFKIFWGINILDTLNGFLEVSLSSLTDKEPRVSTPCAYRTQKVLQILAGNEQDICTSGLGGDTYRPLANGVLWCNYLLIRKYSKNVQH